LSPIGVAPGGFSERSAEHLQGMATRRHVMCSLCPGPLLGRGDEDESGPPQALAVASFLLIFGAGMLLKNRLHSCPLGIYALWVFMPFG